MIDKLKLKFGSSTGKPSLEIDLTPITVFVGPNNSGKSRILIEIENYCRRSHGQLPNFITDRISFIPFTRSEIEEELFNIEQKPKPGEDILPNHIIIGKVSTQENKAKRQQVNKEAIISEALNPQTNGVYFKYFLDLCTVRLDGTSRLNLLLEQSAGDLQSTPQNHLSHLFINNELLKEVRRIIFEAFGKYYVIDPTNIGKLRVRLSDREPNNEREEKGWDAESINFHKKALEITNASDGVRAFSGIITTLLAGDPKITLIDEPEAFLHPALANKLGKEIGEILTKYKKEIVCINS